MGTTYQDFLSALRMRESSGNYTLVNTLGFLGAYQFGEGALVDLGFVRDDGNYHNNDFSGGWTGKLGIDSRAEFLASKSAQDAAADLWFPLVWRYLEAVGADEYLGRVVGGIRITASGLLAGAHLLGAGRVIDWLESGGTLPLKDAYGTPISEYIGVFSGYEMPFETGDVTLNDISDHLAELPDGALTRVEALYDKDGSLIIGDDSAERLLGSAKRDVISGAGGDDLIRGAKSNDALIGGVGNDVLHGGKGADLLTGGADDDRLLGKVGNDVLRGEAGSDILLGGGGNDRLIGGDGDDVLRGHAGRDRLDGGAGDDLLVGGIHADTFVFADGYGADVIADFSRKQGDRIELAGVAGISDFTDLIDNHAAQVGEDVVIETDGGDTLTLVGLSLDTLQAADFLF